MHIFVIFFQDSLWEEMQEFMGEINVSILDITIPIWSHGKAWMGDIFSCQTPSSLCLVPQNILLHKSPWSNTIWFRGKINAQYSKDMRVASQVNFRLRNRVYPRFHLGKPGWARQHIELTLFNPVVFGPFNTRGGADLPLSFFLFSWTPGGSDFLKKRTNNKVLAKIFNLRPTFGVSVT